MEYWQSANSSSASPNPLIDENIRLQSENFSLKAQIRELEHEVMGEKGKVFARDEKVKQLTQAWSQCCDEVNKLSRRNSILRESMDSYEVAGLKIQHHKLAKAQENQDRLADAEELLKDREKTIRDLLARRNPDTLRKLNDVKAQLKEARKDHAEASRKLFKVQMDLDEQLLIAKVHQKEEAVIKTNLQAKNEEPLNKNARLKALEATLNRVTQENIQQRLQLSKSEEMLKKLKWDEQQVKVELQECQRKLEIQWKLNDDLRTQLTQIDFTTVQNFQEAGANLEYQPNEQHLEMPYMFP